MKLRLLSSMAKITISVISIVAVSACVLTVVVKIIEHRVLDVNEYTYSASPMENNYLTLLEGGYWEVQSVEDTLQSVSTDLTKSNFNQSMDLFSTLGASYAYSYKDDKLASFWPMTDAKRILDGWDLKWYENYLLFEAVIPSLQKDNLKQQSGKYSKSYAEFCEVIGSPLPGMAMTGYRDFTYNPNMVTGKNQALGFPNISYELKIQELTKNEMVLTKGSHKIHYKRVKSLPMKIAPISIYFEETAYNGQ